MAAKFGTSGLRGKATDLTEAVVRAHIHAFLQACPGASAVYVGQDRRASSPDIAAWVAKAVAEAGLTALDCGLTPTPALALAAQDAGAAAIMVTGSHIPADRNGLKFYSLSGEITKADEARISAALSGTPQSKGGGAVTTANSNASYVARYSAACGKVLTGMRIGVYQHASVAADPLIEILSALGAETVPLAPSQSFIAVDTEALGPDITARVAGWCAAHRLDVLVSTDGDGDRPLVVDEARRVVPGDILGLLAARRLGAAVICTPITANTLIAGEADVVHTRIGSPYVLAAMAEARRCDPAARVIGFEPNGGLLLGFEATLPGGSLAPLMTRDAALPIIAPLLLAREAGTTLAALIDALPPRFTAADRITGIDTAQAAALLAELRGRTLLTDLGPPQATDERDGLRMTFEGGEILHLRLSGNAPELRCYSEADTPDRAASLVRQALDKTAALLTASRPG